jgi:glucosamine kinase
MSEELVAIGVDIGGTATRALVIDSKGRRLGAGRSGGGNPVTHRPHVRAEAISAALAQALSESGPVVAGSVVAGVAGDLPDDTAASIERIIRGQVGHDCPVQLTGDVIIAFAAGAPDPDGTVLIAGTGSAAAAIIGHAPVREADGLGWLLGDAGSGFWIGRQAVRAALADLDGRGPATSLRPLVVQALLGQALFDQDGPVTDPRAVCQEVIRAVYPHPPVKLSRLAPMVSRCAGAGDQVALGIVKRAVDHLISTVEVVRPSRETTPIVVTGGVATGNHAIAVFLRQQLQARWPGCVRSVRDGAAGAAWLALQALVELCPHHCVPQRAAEVGHGHHEKLRVALRVLQRLGNVRGVQVRVGAVHPPAPTGGDVFR